MFAVGIMVQAIIEKGKCGYETSFPKHIPPYIRNRFWRRGGTIPEGIRTADRIDGGERNQQNIRRFTSENTQKISNKKS